MMQTLILAIWGCTPEPRKILSGNDWSEVSGHRVYPTRILAHVLPGLERTLKPVFGHVGKQLFGDNPRYCWISSHAGKIWDSGVHPRNAKRLRG